MAQTDSENYARCLFPKGHGYPFWVPKPNDSLSQEYRDRGLDIGDVGIITPRGQFDFLFNICLPEYHPINAGRTPPGFTEIALEPSMDAQIDLKGFSVRSRVASGSVREDSVEGDFASLDNPTVPVGIGGSISFSSYSSKFALLCLPDGADRYDLNTLTIFQKAAMENGASWYEHANSGRFGRMCGSIYLVTGCDKSPSWGVASYASASEECEVSLKFTVCQMAGGSASVGYSWERFGPAAVRVSQCPDSSGLAENPKHNQCPFARGFKISVRRGAMSKLRSPVKISVIRGDKPDAFIPCVGNKYLTGDGSKHPSFPGGLGGDVRHDQDFQQAVEGEESDVSMSYSSSPSDSDDNIELFDGVLEPFHPSNVINDWLLDITPGAHLAITHDDAWQSVLEEEDSEFPDSDELIRRIECKYKPTQRIDCATLLLKDPRANPSSHPEPGLGLGVRNHPRLQVPHDSLGIHQYFEQESTANPSEPEKETQSMHATENIISSKRGMAFPASASVQESQSLLLMESDPPVPLSGSDDESVRGLKINRTRGSQRGLRKKACNLCRSRKVKCCGGGTTCTSCYRLGVECIRSSTGRQITKQYVESLEKYAEGLEHHISLLESRNPQFQKDWFPMTPPESELESDTEEGGWLADSGGVRGNDSDGDADIEQLIAPTKRLVLRDGDLNLYGSFSPFAHEQVPNSRDSEDFKSKYAAFMVDGANLNHTHPNLDWARHLPHEVSLYRPEHDRLLDLFFKFVGSWCLRIVPTLFLRDMCRVLSVPSSQHPPRASHYSPMLHNALVAVAMAFSDDPRICDLSSRRYFARKAASYLEFGCQSPNISFVHALSILASFHCSLGELTLGYMYSGMSSRISQVLGLSIDSSPLVKLSLITHDDMLDRNWAHWTTFCQDAVWSLYVGRDFCVLSPSDQQRIPVPFVDPEFDQIPWHYPASGIAPQPGFLLTAFAKSCELLIIARSILDAVSRFGKRSGVNHTIISEIDVRLNAWKASLPLEVDITAAGQATALPHHLMLHLMYWWLFILLHRPFYRGSPSSPISELATDHIKLCNTAAERIMELLHTWRFLYTLRYVPITWNQIVYSAGTIFLLSASQCASETHPSHIYSISQAELCVQYLSEAGKSWHGARQVKDILEKLLRQLTTRMEMHSLEPRQHRMDMEESLTNAQQATLWAESSSGAPMPFTLSTQEWSSLPQSIHQTSQFPMQSSPPGFGPGFSNLYGSGQFVPGFDGDSHSFAVAEHFGFPGIPADHSFTPQPFLSFGDPSLTGFGGEVYDSQQD